MFTGIIEEIGTIRQRIDGSEWGSLVIGASTVLEDTKLGDSIAVNGVCLTVTKLMQHAFQADVMMETFKRTNLGGLTTGTAVHLERALTLSSRLGGHIVSGHVDDRGTITSKTKEGNAVKLEIQTTPEVLAQMVPKGSIAIDGVSLTVIDVTAGAFTVGIIPHTGTNTLLLDKKTGDGVNLETDVLAKYVLRQLQQTQQATTQKKQPITMDFLIQNGF